MNSDTPSRFTLLQERLGLTRGLVRFALILFALSRLGLVALTALVERLVPAAFGAGTALLGPWERYDASFYAATATYGYVRSAPSHWAFFLLQSVATALLRPLVLGDAALAGIVVANLAFLVALLGLAALGLLAALTRQSGLLLVLPFAWEDAASRA